MALGDKTSFADHPDLEAQDGHTVSHTHTHTHI